MLEIRVLTVETHLGWRLLKRGVEIVLMVDEARLIENALIYSSGEGVVLTTPVDVIGTVNLA